MFLGRWLGARRCVLRFCFIPCVIFPQFSPISFFLAFTFVCLLMPSCIYFVVSSFSFTFSCSFLSISDNVVPLMFGHLIWRPRKRLANGHWRVFVCCYKFKMFTQQHFNNMNESQNIRIHYHNTQTKKWTHVHTDTPTHTKAHSNSHLHLHFLPSKPFSWAVVKTKNIVKSLISAGVRKNGMNKSKKKHETISSHPHKYINKCHNIL